MTQFTTGPLYKAGKREVRDGTRLYHEREKHFLSTGNRSRNGRNDHSGIASNCALKMLFYFRKAFEESIDFEDAIDPELYTLGLDRLKCSSTVIRTVSMYVIRQ